MANTGNTQQQINYGAAANDGQGDPLRTAFIKTDDNFDNVWLAGPVGSNITIGNNTIQSNNTNGNIILKPNGVGVIQANASIIPNTDDVRDLGSFSQSWRRAYINELFPDSLTVSGDAVIGGNLTVEGDTIQIGNITTDTLTIQLANTAANAASATGAGITVGANDDIATILYNSSANGWNVNVGLSAVGNISAPYFLGDGSQLTGMYGNANVAANLSAFVNNRISTTGNVNTGNLSVIGNVTASSAGNLWAWRNDTMSYPSGASWRSDRFALDEYISSATDGYLNLQTYDNTSNVATELHMEHGIVQLNIYNGNNVTWEFDNTGNLTLPGNTFAVNYANGTAVNLNTYGNANVAANLAAFANNPISTTGNITGNLVAPGGNGQILYNSSGLIGTSPTNFNFDESSQTLFVKTGTFSGGATGTGSLYAGVPLFTVLGSDVVAQFSGNVDSYTQFNFQNGNSGPLASGDYVITADNGTDSTYFVNLGLGSSNHADPDFFGDTSSPNDAYLYVVGADATGPGDTGPGNLIIGSTNGVIKMFVGNTAQANVVQTISSSGVVITGNTTAGNVLTGGTVSATGNVTGGNILTGGLISATGNITGNLVAPGGNGQILYNSSGLIGTSPTNFNFDESSQTLFVKTGSFTGDSRGENSIYAGVPLFTVLGSDVVAQFSANVDSYTQFNFQNGNSGTQASGDYVITADNGDDTTHFLNLGLTGSNWDGTQPNSLNSRLGPNDGYLYVQDGNLAIGVKDGNVTDWIWRFDITGSVTADGNLIPSANGVYSLGNSTNYWANVWVANNTMYLGGVALGMTAGNVLTVNGNAVLSNNSNTAVSTTGNITAGNVFTGGTVSATGNIDTNANLNVSGDIDAAYITAAANIACGNLIAVETLYGGAIEVTGGSNIAEVSFLNGTVSTTGNITAGNITLTGNITANTAGFAIGYRDIPQVSFTGNATIATADAGKHFYSTQSTDYILTIANNASQGFQTGAAITVVNQGTGNITVAQGSGVTLYLAGNATSGNRTVTTFGMATIMKVATDTWFINGTGVS